MMKLHKGFFFLEVREEIMQTDCMCGEARNWDKSDSQAL